MKLGARTAVRILINGAGRRRRFYRLKRLVDRCCRGISWRALGVRSAATGILTRDGGTAAPFANDTPP